MGKIRNTRWNTHPRNTQYPERYTKQSPEPKKPDHRPVLLERQDLWYKVNSTIPFTGTQGRYQENGQLIERTNFKDGNKDGLWEEFYKNGQLRNKGNYKNGNKVGLWEEYLSTGSLYRKENYKEGKLDFKETYNEDGSIDKSGCGGCLGVLIGLGIIILLLFNV